MNCCKEQDLVTPVELVTVEKQAINLKELCFELDYCDSSGTCLLKKCCKIPANEEKDVDGSSLGRPYLGQLSAECLTELLNLCVTKCGSDWVSQ